MYIKIKRPDVSNIKQFEDKNTRFDYGKTTMDVSSGMIGENENIKDIR